MFLLTHPHSLHLCPEGIQQLKQDQTQRVNVHFMRVGVSRKLRNEITDIDNKITSLGFREIYQP